MLSTAESLQAEDQRAHNLVHRIVEIVNDRHLDALPEVATGQIAREAERWIGPFRDSFPDFHMDVVHVIAETDTFVGHFKCSRHPRG